MKSCSYRWRPNFSLDSLHCHTVPAESAQCMQQAGIKELLTQSELTCQGCCGCLTFSFHYRVCKGVAVITCFRNICEMERGCSASKTQQTFSTYSRCVCTACEWVCAVLPCVAMWVEVDVWLTIPALQSGVGPSAPAPATAECSYSHKTHVCTSTRPQVHARPIHAKMN